MPTISSAVLQALLCSDGARFLKFKGGGVCSKTQPPSNVRSDGRHRITGNAKRIIDMAPKINLARENISLIPSRRGLKGFQKEKREREREIPEQQSKNQYFLVVRKNEK